MADNERQIVLPVSVIGPVEVRRMARELEEVDDFLRQAALKHGTSSLPKVTKALADLAEANSLNLLQPVDRAEAGRVLEVLQTRAPVLHMSFAADPSAAFLDRILRYVRQNIHALTLVQVGLQPSIGAGCEVRTNNKVFDFSLRQSLTQKRQLLIDALTGLERR